MRLSIEMRDLLVEMLEEEYITSKNNGIYSSRSSFYETIMLFRNKGLVFSTGRNRWNRKKWRLTDIGQRIAKTFREVKNL